MTSKARIRGALIVTAVVVATQLAHPGPAAAVTLPPGGVTVISKISLFDSNNKTFSAACPAGNRVLGGGGFISGTSHAVLTELQPITTAGGDRFQVSAAEDQLGEAGTWAILAYAFCATAPAGLEIVNSTSVSASDPFASQSAQCPAGKRLIGAGGKINFGSGQVGLLTHPEGSVGPIRTTAAGLEDLDGFSGNWNVTSYAVCVIAGSVLDLRVVQNAAAGDGSTFKQATATCPSGMIATGGGGWVDLPAHVEFIKPNTGTNPTSVDVAGRAAGGFTSTVTALAICAK